MNQSGKAPVVRKNDELVEIDLLALLRIIWQARKQLVYILLGTLLLALFIVLVLLPNKYETVSLIYVSPDDELLRYDGRITEKEVPTEQAFQIYASLAGSLGLLQDVAVACGETDDPDYELYDFIENFEVETDITDDTVLTFKVTEETPEKALALHVCWLDVFIPRAIGLYGASSEKQGQDFTALSAEARVSLDATELAVEVFLLENSVRVAELQLEEYELLRRQQANLLHSRILFVENINTFLQTTPPADGLGVLQLLQFQTNTLQNGAEVDRLFQLNLNELESLSASNVINDVKELQAALQADIDTIRAALRSVDVDIASQKARVEALKLQERQLRIDHDVALANYQILERKLAEVQVSRSLALDGVRAVTQPILPTKDAIPHSIYLAIVWILLFSMLSIGWLVYSNASAFKQASVVNPHRNSL